MISKIKQATPIVMKVLENYPKARNSDKELTIRCWEEQGLFLTDEQKARFRACHSTETYRRTRQKIQEQGMYKADDNIRHQRLKNDVEMRNTLSGKRLVFEGGSVKIIDP